MPGMTSNVYNCKLNISSNNPKYLYTSISPPPLKSSVSSNNFNNKLNYY
jgi:hypothetical protein